MTGRSWPLRPSGMAASAVTSVRGVASGGIGRRPLTPTAVAGGRHGAGSAQAVWPSHFAWVVIPAAVISAVVVVGVALGSGSIAMVGAGLALLAAVLAPEVGLAVLATLAPLQPPPSIPAPGLNFLLVGALLVGCIYRLPLDRPALRLSKAGLFLLGFVIYVTAQQVPEMLGGYRGEDRAIGYLFFQVTAAFGAVLVAGYVFRGRSPIPVLTMAFVGAAIATTLAVATFENPDFGPFGRLVATTELGVRAAGAFVNPNYMGTFAGAVLVGIAAIWTSVGSRPARVLLAGLAILCLISIVEAQSRGAIIAAFAGIAIVAWLRNRSLAVGIVVVGIVAAAVIYPAFLEWRLTNEQGNVSDAGYVQLTVSDDARLNASLAGPAMFAAEPIFGVGFGRFVEKSVEISGLETGINAHNWYVNVLAEQGTTGALLWVGAIVATIVQLRSRRGVAQVVGIGMFTLLIVAFNFLEVPMSFQLVAVPSLFLVAALVADWPDRLRPGIGTDHLIESKGATA